MSETTDSLGDWKRTHDCGTLGTEHIGQSVTLMGWVARRRDHGGVIFLDLRDRCGITQVVFNPQRDAVAHARADRVRNEYVIAAQGVVEARPEGMVNPKLETGAIEVNCGALRLLNPSAPPPFAPDDSLEALADAA